MATTRETLEFLIKADGSAAAGQFRKLGNDMDQVAQKVGSSSGLKGQLFQLGSFLGNNLPAVAATAAGALAALGLKTAASFADMALAAGKLSDATGLSAEQAGRWVEVAGDIGVSSETITSAFGKLNKTIGENPAKWEAVGITATDTQGRILQAIDAINATEDPAAKSALAAQLFGRGWQQAAELIAEGSGQIKVNLEAVADVKAVSDDDVSAAREYRASMDALGDSIEELGLALGKSLVPGIAAAAAGIAKLLNTGPIKQALDIIGAGAEAAGVALRNLSDWDGPTPEAYEGVKRFADVLSMLQDKLNTGDSLGTGQIKDFLAVSKNSGESRKALEANIQAAVEYRDGMNLAAKAEAQWKAAQEPKTKALKDGTAATDDQAKAVEALGGKLRDLATDYDTSAGRAKAWQSAVEQGSGGILAAKQQTADYNDALTDLTAGFKKNGESIDENTEKGRANLDNLEKVQGAIGSLIDAQLKNGASLADAGKAAGEYRDKLDGVLRKAGFTEKQIEEYNTALGLTPKQIETTVKLAGQEEARLKLQALNADLDKLPSEVATRIRQDIITGDYTSALNKIQQYYNQHSVTVRVNAAPGTVFNPSIPGGSKIPGRGKAAGGRAAGLTLVGERGPEILELPTGSNIVPNHQLGGLGGATIINIGTVETNDPARFVAGLEAFVTKAGKSRLQRLIA